jgi:hypothetical protein
MQPHNNVILDLGLTMIHKSIYLTSKSLSFILNLLLPQIYFKKIYQPLETI